MNSYEHLEDEACRDGIDVISYKFQSSRIKGLYSNGIIGINNNIKDQLKRLVFYQKKWDIITHPQEISWI